MQRDKAILEITRRKFDFFLSADNVIESKANSLLGFEIALCIGYVGLFIKDLEEIRLIGGISGIFLLLFSMTYLLYIIWPRSYYSGIVQFDKYPKYHEMEEVELCKKLMLDTEEALKENKKLWERKSSSYKRALYFLLGSIFFFLFSLSPSFTEIINSLINK